MIAAPLMNIALTLSRKITVGFALAFLVTVIVSIVSYRNATNYIDSAATVNRTQRSIALLHALVANVASAESEARGFVITGSEDFLVLHRSAKKDATQDIAELRSTVRDPDNTRRINELEQLMHERFSRLEVSLETRRLEGLEAIPKTTGPGKRLMDELRKVAGAIESRQLKLLADRDERAGFLAERTISTVLIAGIFASTVGATGVFLLRSDLAQRERLEKEVLEISEREQRRIGQDLHDDLCQQLTGISLLSRSLQQQLTGPVSESASKVTHLINECIEQTRRVTRGLHPVPDEPTGLQLALTALAASVSGTAHTPCVCQCPQPVPIPDQIAATNLYRIAQEAVQNALRHSGAGRIEIGLGMDETAITLSVRDDGRGIDQPTRNGGLGLDIMRYRANSMGASLDIAPAPGGGTAVTCMLPRKAID